MIYLVFSTDQWQTKDSYELEGVCSTLNRARDVVQKIFDEYPTDTKSVIKTTKINTNIFTDLEVYDCESGLEWKLEESLYA